MPLAFKNVGLILGSLFLWLMAIVCIHGMHILLNCYKHALVNYPRLNGGKKLPEKVGYDDVVYFVMKEKFNPDSKVPKYLKRVISSFLIFMKS